MLLKEEQAKNTQAPPNPGCNCNPGPCPLATNNCQVDHVIYQAKVKDENQAINTCMYTQGSQGILFKNATLLIISVLTTGVKIQQRFQRICGI